MTINNNTGLIESGNWNEYNLNPLTRIHWRASLVPAAAVIPAPRVYTKAVAVKKLVVNFGDVKARSLRRRRPTHGFALRGGATKVRNVSR